MDRMNATSTTSLEKVLRNLVADEIRHGLREELTALGFASDDQRYLPVAPAAARIAVAPATIRTWIAQGKLRR